MSFSLENFETLVYSRQHEEATKELLKLLGNIEQAYGGFGTTFNVVNTLFLNGVELDSYIIGRLTSAITTLFLDPDFSISEAGFWQMITFQRWLACLFAVSTFKNADHIIKQWDINQSQSNAVELRNSNLLKFCLLYFPMSQISLDFDILFQYNKILAASLALVLLSSRFSGSKIPYEKREILLPWLYEKLPEIESIDFLPSAILHDVYMHCSYARRADKHDVKKAINILVRKKLDQLGLGPVQYIGPKNDEKPVMLVVLEWFNENHSIYRTHSKTIEAARDKFNVIGVGFDYLIDDAGKAIFDQFIPIEGSHLNEHLQSIRNIAEKFKPGVFYMPSVGMFPLTMYLANLRLAPVQAMGLGHPATTHSLSMDFAVVEEDYVGDPHCFSEKLLILPKDGMPYRPSAMASNIPVEPKVFDKKLTNFAIASTPMKLNPDFMETCQKILQKLDGKAHFHFLVGHAQGLIFLEVSKFVQAYLGTYATVYPHQNYGDYINAIRSCDLFINPFPFGNTNGIVDCVTAGLVGICKTGPEVHEHIDEGIFGRLNFPTEFIADSIEAYVDAAVALAKDPEGRAKWVKNLSGPDRVQHLFEGRPNIMGNLFYKELLNQRNKEKLTA